MRYRKNARQCWLLPVAATVALLLTLIIQPIFTAPGAEAQRRSCPAGYQRSGQRCVKVRGPSSSKTAQCPPGYISRRGVCRPPSRPQTANCGAYQVRKGRSCECVAGYVRKGGACVPGQQTVSCGPYQVAKGRSCECLAGYVRKSGGCVPRQPEVACKGPYEVRKGDGCGCLSGYIRRGNACIAQADPCKGPYEVRRGDSCGCVAGYVRSGNTCVTQVVTGPCGPNQIFRGSRCYCEGDYNWRGRDCVPRKPPVAVTPPIVTPPVVASCAANEVRRDGRCVCAGGYDRRGGECVRVERVSSPAERALMLPNAALKQYLEQFKKPQTPPPDALEKAPVRDYPTGSLYKEQARKDGPINQPLHAKDEAVILLDAAMTPAQVRAKIKRYDLRVINAVPNIGALHVDIARLRKRLRRSQQAPDLDRGRLGLPAAIDMLAADPNFVSVTPNAILTPNQIISVIVPKPAARTTTSSITSAVSTATTELVDWGIYDAKIDQAWGQLGGQAFREGVIDVGFAQHEDLKTVAGLPRTGPGHDHGNHVAGILCAQHNGRGIKGAIPNCTAVVARSQALRSAIEPVELGESGRVNTSFFLPFADIIVTVNDFMEKNEDIKSINLSLGLNWTTRLGINPSESKHSEARAGIEGMGLTCLRTLAAAKAKDVVFISAAGNDSPEDLSPIPAEWSSPFNWAALQMGILQGWANAVIVEAHDRDGARAFFSNSGGHISAPGVDVRSAVAAGTDRYGVMSGTSMASPYVAGGLSILRRVRSDLDLRQAIQCLLSTPAKTNRGTPKLDLMNAIANCRP